MSSSEVCWMCNWSWAYCIIYLRIFILFWLQKSLISPSPKNLKIIFLPDSITAGIKQRKCPIFVCRAQQKEGTRALILLQNQAWALPWEFSVQQLLSDQSCPNQPWPLLFLKVESSGKLYVPWSSILKKGTCKSTAAEPLTLRPAIAGSATVLKADSCALPQPM